MNGTHSCASSTETFSLGERLGKAVKRQSCVLLTGGLGAGKTLFTKGILQALGYDIDEVTSPSFSLVNLYRTPGGDVYHIDLWRLDSGPGMERAVGLEEIIETDPVLIIIEWAERLGNYAPPMPVTQVHIEGSGDETRDITITSQL